MSNYPFHIFLKANKKPFREERLDFVYAGKKP